MSHNSNVLKKIYTWHNEERQKTEYVDEKNDKSMYVHSVYSEASEKIEMVMEWRVK